MSGNHKHCPECGEPLARLYDVIACPNGDFEKPMPPMGRKVEYDPDESMDGAPLQDDLFLATEQDDGDYLDRRYTGAVW